MNFILRIYRVTLILLSIFLLTPVLTQAQITSTSTPVIDSFDTRYSGWTVTASQVDFATTSSNTFNNTTGAIACNQGLRCRIQKTGVALSEGQIVVRFKAVFPISTDIGLLGICEGGDDSVFCSGHGLNTTIVQDYVYPYFHDLLYHSKLIAWRNGPQYKEFCSLLDSLDLATCSWDSSAHYSLSDTYGQVALGVQNGVPPGGYFYFDEVGNFSTTTATTTQPSCTVDCNDNVLFLPGIEGSRLYKPDYNGGTDQLWEPNVDSDVKALFLKPDGTSARDDIYVKKGDIIDELPDGENIYKSFIAKMDGLKNTQHLITDWEAVPYDWRLSIDDILNNGAEINGRIYYGGSIAPTSTPYIIQELRRLAASSRTHKVTIVAHSNGGLVAKRLTQLLGTTTATQLISRIIFVAVPQVGTPVAIPADLHGHDQSHLGGIILSKETARTFASTSPMAYNLLPSARYFTQVDDPVVSFDPITLPDYVSRYGNVIHSQERLHTFLADTYGRADAQTGDINQPIQLSNTLLLNAEALHSNLDNWVAPSGVQLIQIAGWGVPTTVKGIEYSKPNTTICIPAGFGYDTCTTRPVFTFSASTTVDGDGTVVVPSALWTSTSTGAVNYWVNMGGWNSKLVNKLALGLFNVNHGNILEVTNLNDFISDSITNVTKPLSSYTYLFNQAPLSTDIRLRYSLHSPLTLNLYDDQGHHTGVSTTTGQVEEQIPGTYYMEFGDVKYIFTDASSSAHVVMNGYAPGTFTFNADEYIGNSLIASTTFKDIPTTASTTVSLNVQSDITTLSPMSIDKNGDGTIDSTITPKINGIVTLDTTPPEIRISFATSTNSLLFIGLDDSGTTTISSTTSYPILKKNQKNYNGIATTTVTARDEAGNTTNLIYTEKLPSPNLRDIIIPIALVYNGATTSISTTSLSYKWRLNQDNAYKLFSSYIRTSATSTEFHYRPKKNQTIVMTKPIDLDDGEGDDDSDSRPIRIKVSGLLIPNLTTMRGSIFISY